MPDHIPLELCDLRCNGCGAPLMVPDHANYVTCQHCHAQLAVKRTASAAYTEVLEAFTREAAGLRDQVKRLALQNELTALDQSWERERERHLHYGKNRRPAEPSIGGSLFGGIVAAIFGVFIMSTGGPGAIIGMLAIVAGIVGAVIGLVKASQFEDARGRYESQRKTLLSRIESDRQQD